MDKSYKTYYLFSAFCLILLSASVGWNLFSSWTLTERRDRECRDLCGWMGDEFVGTNDLGCLCQQQHTGFGEPGDPANYFGYNLYEWCTNQDR